MTINEITQNTNYRDALSVLRTGNNWSLAEFVSENKLPLQGAITSYTDEETGKITRYLLLGTKRFQREHVEVYGSPMAELQSDSGTADQIKLLAKEFQYLQQSDLVGAKNFLMHSE